MEEVLTIKDPEPELLTEAELAKEIKVLSGSWVWQEVGACSGLTGDCAMHQWRRKGTSMRTTARETGLNGANQLQGSTGEKLLWLPVPTFPGRKRSAAASIKSLFIEARKAGSCPGRSVLLCKASSDVALEGMHHFHNLLIMRSL